MTQPYQYRVPDLTGDQLFKFRSSKFTRIWIAEDAADDFYHHHEGHDAAWPLNIVLCDPVGNEIGKYLVGQEMTPTFWAKESK